MKKINLLFIAGLLLMGSCNQDEAEQDSAAKGFAPKITASVEKTPTTRAGVIESGNYTLGEKFYWSVGDNTSVLFDDTKLDYTVVSMGTQRNQAIFTTDGALPTADTYDVRGYFPAKAWNVTTRVATMPITQTQTDRTSKHLGDYMLMKAQSNRVVVDAESTIDLQYKQLASMFRFAVWNATERTELKLTNINVRLKTWANSFGTKGTLTNLDDASLTVADKVTSINLALTGTAQDFAPKDNMQQCEGYMVALPTTFTATDEFILTFTLKDGDKEFLFNDSFSVSATGLDFLKDGIEQGKSYFFQLKIEEDKLTTTITRPTIETVEITNGWFTMGTTGNKADEMPHKVTLTKNFRMSKNLITNAQYAAFLNAVGVGSDGKIRGTVLIKDSSDSPWGLKYVTSKWVPFEGYENHPVIFVSWAGADQFAKWVGGSLPTDAQWEYACRAGTTTPTHLPDGDSIDDYAWHTGNSKGTTKAVGQKEPNPWGLYDMYGNVIEWCFDLHATKLGTGDKTDPTGATTASSRVIRNGGWNAGTANLRSAYRWYRNPTGIQNNIGFRIVLTAAQ